MVTSRAIEEGIAAEAYVHFTIVFVLLQFQLTPFSAKERLFYRNHKIVSNFGLTDPKVVLDKIAKDMRTFFGDHISKEDMGQ